MLGPVGPIGTLLLLVGVALVNGDYSLSWHVVSGGGGHVEAGDCTLDSTVGQAVAETDMVWFGSVRLTVTC